MLNADRQTIDKRDATKKHTGKNV